MARQPTMARQPGISAAAPWWNTVIRVLAAGISAVIIAIGAIALLRIDWTDGVDALPVSVAGMAFSPLTALTTLGIGIVALLAAVSPDRGSKLFVGTLLLVAGIVVLVNGRPEGRWALEDGHGWLAIGLGAVLAIAAVALRPIAVDTPVSPEPYETRDP
jgi:hypothetical protein